MAPIQLTYMKKLDQCGAHNRPMCRFVIVLTGLLISGSVAAGQMMDYIRDYDLNDFALGIAVTTKQNPFAGTENSTYAYPYLTSFHDSALTDDWFYISDGAVGLRWVNDAGWELGVAGRIQTLGFGNSDSPELLGIADRRWTLEVGPAIGWRRWPVHLNFNLYSEVTDRHDGFVSDLAISWPMAWSRGYFVPSVEFIHQDADYADYYYSVTAAEATPTRPSYSGGSAESLALRARWGYALNEQWLLSGSFGVEKLDSSITDSPIVTRDKIYSGHIGIAYNVDVFKGREYLLSTPGAPRFDLRIGSFYDSISTKVARDTSDGVPGFETDIEDILGAADQKAVLQVDATVRLGHYHRLEFGYFELGRNSSTTLSNDLIFGDEVFAAGSEIVTRMDARIFRAAYSYSLIRDAQKELAVMVGAHVLNFELDIASSLTGQEARSSAGTPLPVIGASASIFLSEKTTVGAKIQIFRTDFDRFEGSLNFASLDIQHRFAESFGVGIGYNYYGMKLSSNESAVNGYLNVRHHGPTVFFTVVF